PLIAVDAPLLLEKDLDRKYCDAVLCVDAPRDERIRRVRDERGWTDAELDRREENQMDPAEKKQRADYVVRNDGSTQALREALARVWQQLTGGPPPETDT
ncbi:MAG: dephospho-CoA kinase, partial [Planctomycetota bacterium]